MSSDVSSGPKRTKAYEMSREGIRAVVDFFEKNSHVIQEVPQQYDFGRDCFVDLVEEGRVTGITIGLQVRSGESFRTSSGDYSIAVNSHGDMWRNCTVPFFGVVYDPSSKGLYWADITRLLAEAARSTPTIIIPRTQRLDSSGGLEALLRAASDHAIEPVNTLAARLLSADHEVQELAVGQVWALSRHSTYTPVLLRRLILELGPEATHIAIWIMSLIIGHSDAVYASGTWASPAARQRLLESLRFSAVELVHMYRSIDIDQWARGELGQALEVIMDSALELTESVIEDSSRQLLALGETTSAVRLIGLYAWRQADPQSSLNRLVLGVSALEQNIMMCQWLEAVSNGQGIDLY